MTNREAHEEAAGMGLDDMFFRFNKIDPDAEVVDQMLEDAKAFNVPGWTLENHGIVWTIPELMARFATKQIERQTPAIIERFVEEMEKELLDSDDPIPEGGGIRFSTFVEAMRKVAKTKQ